MRGKATLMTVPSRNTAPDPRTTAARVPRSFVTWPDDDPMTTDLDLFDWRRRVASMYRLSDVAAFRAARDELFGTHPQSPVPPEERASFAGLRYFDADPRYRVRTRLEPGEPGELEIDTG